ncbi:MAG: phosphoribosylamine--glycine ligase [Burkholderiaceae bacterium]
MAAFDCLVIGSGGREHALAWRLTRSPSVQTVWVAPGNGGTAAEPRVRNLPLTDILALAEFARRERIGLTVVGPEAPLAAGIVDTFRARNLPIFGPTKAAARLEASKTFAKEFMVRHRIPTALSRTFTDPAAAHAFINDRGAPIVVKADGLASGKGVVVAATTDEAHAAIDRMMVESRFGAAGMSVLIEERLEGEEASFIVMVDGRNVLALATSQDHKRLHDGDLGPNTGGMGAYSPAAIVTPEIHRKVLREIIVPTVEGMNAEGQPYTGFLYAGLMIDRHGDPKVIEFNCRLGDPEAQPILARMKSDLAQLLRAGIDGRLDQVEVEWDRRHALCVVLAAQGYPDDPHAGARIDGLPTADGHDDARTLVFHAGTRRAADTVLVCGGRVLGVTGLGDSLKRAQATAYETVRRVRFEGMQYRTDIGHHGLPAAGATGVASR